MITSFLSVSLDYIKSPYVMLFVFGLSLMILFYSIFLLSNPKLIFNKNNIKPTFYLIGFFLGYFFATLAWFLRILSELSDFVPYYFSNQVVRFSWLFMILQYQSIITLQLHFAKRSKLINVLFYLVSYGNILFAVSYLYIIFFEKSMLDNRIRQATFQAFQHSFFEGKFELWLMKLSVTAWWVFIASFFMYLLYVSIIKAELPKILKNQLISFFTMLFAPFIIKQTVLFYEHASVAVVSIWVDYLTIAGVAFCGFSAIKKILKLRFLNLTLQVQVDLSQANLEPLKDLVIQLATVNKIHDIFEISRQYFVQLLNVPAQSVSVYTTNCAIVHDLQVCTNSRYQQCSQFFDTTSLEIKKFISESQVLVYDDLVFSRHYDVNLVPQEIINFLEKIDADIVIPLYQADQIVGYIIIDQGVRNSALYNSVEQSQMLIFANYVSSIIHLFNQRSLEVVAHQEKELRDNLYVRQQEIKLYKESMHHVLKLSQEKKIGLLFYRSRKLVFGNALAHDLIGASVDEQDNNVILREIKKIAQYVYELKLPRSCLVKKDNSSQLMVAAMPGFEANNVLITVYPVALEALTTDYTQFMNNQEFFDYALYLQTTKAGQKINDFIPVQSATFIQFKIELLKQGIGKKIVCFDMNTEDAIAVAILLHEVSGRNTLYQHSFVPSMSECLKGNGETNICHDKDTLVALIQRAHSGTVFLENIDRYCKHMQEALKYYTQYGTFNLRSVVHAVQPSARLICTTSISPDVIFSSTNEQNNAFHDLSISILKAPFITQVPWPDYCALVDEYTNQVIKQRYQQATVYINDREKEKILRSGVRGFVDLKNKVAEILENKMKHYHDTEVFTPVSSSSALIDNELSYAQRLGKSALKDERLMRSLWTRLHNQNRIADLLGVNRSSVNRRFKEYGIS